MQASSSQLVRAARLRILKRNSNAKRLSSFLLAKCDVEAMYLVISTSLNVRSRSRLIANRAHELLTQRSSQVNLLDLSQYDLPIDCGRPPSDESTREATQRVAEAAGVVFVLPVYRNEVAVAARNLVQLCGSGMQRKVVGLMAVADDVAAHVSTLAFANTLMLEHKCFIIPDLVFAKSGSLTESSRDATKVEQEMEKLVRHLTRVTESLKSA